MRSFADNACIIQSSLHQKSRNHEKKQRAGNFWRQPVTLMGKQVKEGHPVKNFLALTNDLKPFSLSDYQGKVRILSSVPSIDMDVCAQQARRFNMEASSLDDVQIINISCDLPFALKRFCAAEGVENLVTVSDSRDRDFGIKYGLLIEEFGILTRAVIVIDKDDTVRYIEIVNEASGHPDYDKALGAAKKLV